MRDVLAAAASITRDAARARLIADVLPDAYKTLYALAGSGGGSNEGIAIAKVKAKAAAIDPSAQRAKEIGNDYTPLYRASADDLSSTLARLTADQVNVRALLDDFMAEHSNVGAATMRAVEEAKRVDRLVRGH